MANKKVLVLGAGIMASHMLYRHYDPVYPTTLSNIMVQKKLREELGFKGLILTDCLEMKAIADMYGTSNGALMAVLAGADICDISHTLEFQLKALELLEEAVNDSISNSSIAKLSIRT